MTPKEEAIREVLSIREKHCQKARRLALFLGNKESAAYYEGKADGYNKAMKEIEQKEQKPDIEICPHSIKSKSYKENGYPIEQKPVQTEEEREYVRVLKSLISDFIRDNYKTTDISFYQQIYDWLDGRHIEQKPIEIKIDNPNIQKFDPDVKVTTSDSSASGKELLYVSNKSYDIGYRDGVNSVKPAEWSEEDEKILDSLIRLYSIEYSEYVCPWANGDITYGDVVNFLKSLRPQPHWKPSEVQMKALQRAIDACESEWDYKDDELRSLLTELKKL